MCCIDMFKCCVIKTEGGWDMLTVRSELTGCPGGGSPPAAMLQLTDPSVVPVLSPQSSLFNSLPLESLAGVTFEALL